MARVYLDAYGVQDIRALVSLGSPLNAVPKGVPGVVDQTRASLTWAGENCATAADLGVPVTCLAGRWLEGRAGAGARGGGSRAASPGSSSGRGTSRCAGTRARGATGSRQWLRRI